ncbi:epoxide hydrolase family protein [Puia sp.]|uniref:epoxide hydrolase family protein n=1 Tax=Puia sp. TaxID=2045100 RepID=UPI002F42B0A1
MSTQRISPTKTRGTGVSIEPYTISISPFVIEDLRERIGRARWPDEIGGSGWRYGTNEEYLKQLCTHWANGFDWKEQEDQLNALHHFRATIDGINLHFVHEKGKGRKRVPLMLIHGWPDSFTRFLKMIPLLAAEGPDGISFDLVIPSIPGYGFSDRPGEAGMNFTRVAELFGRLMRELGYPQYMVHGGDLGSSIAEQLAIAYPEAVLGIHLLDVPYMHFYSLKPEELTPPEKKYIQAGQQWQMQEGAYGLLQSTKPQTLAYALNDSPIGLAAWIIEKFYSWSDQPGDLEKVYTRDELLVNLTIYWATQTVGSAARIYYESMHTQLRQAKGRLDTPTAVCIPPRDMVPAPREFAERFFNIMQWTELGSGGHFVPMERPDVVAGDLFHFATKLW